MVLSVVYAVDVVELSAPSRPLPITYTSLGEARHPTIVGIQTVAEVKILHLDLMLTGSYAVNDALVLAREGETIE